MAAAVREQIEIIRAGVAVLTIERCYPNAQGTWEMLRWNAAQILGASFDSPVMVSVERAQSDDVQGVTWLDIETRF